MSTIPSDPVMLLSFVNTKLRDEFTSLDLLCNSINVDKSTIINKLKIIDYDYIPSANQFK